VNTNPNLTVALLEIQIPHIKQAVAADQPSKDIPCRLCEEVVVLSPGFTSGSTEEIKK